MLKVNLGMLMVYFVFGISIVSMADGQRFLEGKSKHSIAARFHGDSSSILEFTTFPVGACTVGTFFFSRERTERKNLSWANLSDRRKWIARHEQKFPESKDWVELISNFFGSWSQVSVRWCTLRNWTYWLQKVVEMMDPVCHVGASTNPSQFEVPEDMQHLGIGGIGIGDGHHNSFVNTLIYSQVWFEDRGVVWVWFFFGNRLENHILLPWLSGVRWTYYGRWWTRHGNRRRDHASPGNRCSTPRGQWVRDLQMLTEYYCTLHLLFSSCKPFQLVYRATFFHDQVIHMDLARDEIIINGKDIRDRSPSQDSMKDGIVLEVPDIKQERELVASASPFLEQGFSYCDDGKEKRRAFSESSNSITFKHNNISDPNLWSWWWVNYTVYEDIEIHSNNNRLLFENDLLVR